MNVSARLPSIAGLELDHAFGHLPPQCFRPAVPHRVSSPRLIAFNSQLAADLQLDADWLQSQAGVELLSGNALPAGCHPIAQAYAGHQFGAFTARLGDGRAVLIGDATGPDEQRYEVQLKGTGPTPFALGDGRLTLAAALREHLFSETLFALGIPTTRALAVLATGDTVMREGAQSGGILVRIAPTHLRIGSFQRFAVQHDLPALRALADYAIARHCPDLAQTETPYEHLLRFAVHRQARLVAAWMASGFMHGVMNTDNIAIGGETLDYGPCAFLETYAPGATPNTDDRDGRYAFGRQVAMMRWNLAQLADALAPLLSPSQFKGLAIAQAIAEDFTPAYEQAYRRLMRRKLGLLTETDADDDLIARLLAIMEAEKRDFTQTFADLASPAAPALEGWHTLWRRRIAHEPGGIASVRQVLASANPKYIPRHAAIAETIAAALSGNVNPFTTLLATAGAPFASQSL